MVKFVETESNDQRLFVFTEPHISGGEATVLITGAQIVEYMRVMSSKPFGCIHSDWINEFCEVYGAVLVEVPVLLGHELQMLEN